MNSVDPHAPLRVIQVVNVRWFNATAWYGLFLSSLLRDAGHEVRVLCLEGTECFEKAREMGLGPEPLALNSPLTAGAAYYRLSRLVRDFRPHIVNCHRGESFILWGMLKASGAFRLVRTRGDQRPPKGNLPNILLHTKAADAVIATCSGIAAHMRDILRVPEDRVHTILGGVDTRRFYPDAASRARMRESLGLRPDQTAIGLIGRFDAVKGQQELLVAYSRLRHMSGDAAGRLRLVLAGFSTTATGEEAVRGWADAAGVADSVIFPGRCDAIHALMNALDVGVVASLDSETIARVALEIMACGVPLIGTRVGVMPDLLREETLVPPGDTEAMALALQRFTSEPSFGEGMRAEQHTRMRDLGEKDFLEKTLAVYQSVLAS